MNNSPTFSPGKVSCGRCQKPIGKDAKYCPHCGAYRNDNYVQAAREQYEIIASIVFFYIVYMAVALTSPLPLYLLIAENAVAGVIIIQYIAAFIILGYWKISRVSLRPLFRFNKKTAYYLLVGIGFLVLLLGINMGYHLGLNEIFGARENSTTELFINGRAGFGTVVFALCLMPAVWEEIAFRGIIQTRLSKKFRKRETLFITSGLFALIHGDAISWPYYFLVGVTLGYLRMKSQSLWPAVVVHFLHNFLAVLPIILVD